MKKPKQLLLPPEYIYTTEFHKWLLDQHDILPEYHNKKYVYAWHQAIRRRCGFGFTIADVKGFCQSIYGICKRGHCEEDLLSSILYLEGVPEVSRSFLDPEYRSRLEKKYHSVSWAYYEKTVYVLLSSRINPRGEE